MKHALNTTRAADFAAWYQEVITAADMAEESGVRGCMIIRPWGYGIWERIQRLMDDRIKAAGVQNAYFPLFIPLSYFAKEAEHVDGFAKEMAVVTHHRLIPDGKGSLMADPEAKLEEPLIVRPTSETVIGAAMARWVQSWRDLPLMVNQWANVVRWEMRTRMFLRTSEFLWQEGHTAHANREDAMTETLRALEMYREFSETVLAMPVIAGEKPEHERFPGATATYSIEAMMQDGKALQAGTSHYLGTSFAEAAGIRYQDRDGGHAFAHTTSWGTSTRMIGGVIMVHGDDDGLRVPPAIAPYQIVIVPMLREDDGDAAVLDYGQALVAELTAQSALGEPIRVLFDKRPGKAQGKRWEWLKKGAPLVVEIGPRDVEGGQISWIDRSRLYITEEDALAAFQGDPPQHNLAIGKIATVRTAREQFIQHAAARLEAVQASMLQSASERMNANIRRDLPDWSAIDSYFKENAVPGWVEVCWSKPTGAALDAVVDKVKALKLTMRNVPLDAAPAVGICPLTGEPAVERILIGRAY